MIASGKKKKILFLGYGKEKTKLINILEGFNFDVHHTNEKVDTMEEFNLVICFGYRHIIPKSIIKRTNVTIINLHISYLPWNRGAHPNFWSFFDCTPSGVTIHIVDTGIDTGPILYQRYINFSEEEKTFSQTYQRLLKEVEYLFLENIEAILDGKYVAKPQRRAGTFHRLSDLPPEFSGWDSDISEEINRLDSLIIQRGK